jgi:hypothetical protein
MPAREQFLEAYKKCAPSATLNEGTCFLREELMCLTRAAEKLLGMHASPLIDALNNEEILLYFDDFMQASALQSNAWLENPKLMREIRKTCPKLAESILAYRLTPSYKPTSEPGWTTNVQLDRIMFQFVRAFSDVDMPIEYLGAYNNKPMEWICGREPESQCASPIVEHFEDPEMHDVPFAAILNTSYYGTHWVAVYVENADSPIEYFDSFGLPVPLSLSPALKWLARGFPNKIVRTNQRHQYDDFSCGPFSVYYIVQRHFGTPMKWFADHKIEKKEIDEFRGAIFDRDPAHNKK